MGAPTIQIERLQWFAENPITTPDGKDAYPGCDGAVWYLVLAPCQGAKCPFRGDKDEPCGPIHCLTHPMEHHHYLLQPFRRGPHGHRPNATRDEIHQDRGNVWGWDGNRVVPTIEPSYLVPYPEGYTLWPRVHLFVRAGRIDLCSDSQCVVHPDPVACQEPPGAAAS